MLNYLRTPATRRRNVEDRLGRIRSGGSPRSDSRETSGSRSRTRSRREPDRTAAERILRAGRGSRRRGLDVEPEAERATEFILSAEEPDQDTERAVEMIKEAGEE